jgi:serine/threonine protein kinase
VIGELIAGKYRVEGELGQGGMGTVYRSRIVKNARPVAIKILRPDIVGQQRFEARFEAEVLVTSRIKHPNIVEVLDHGYLEDGRLYLVLELLTGLSLGEVMLASDALAWQRSLRITREVALALGAVHSQGVVHRDIKPENIFLLPIVGGESVKLMDFGLAKTLVAEGEVDPEEELTQPGFAIGTPTYMAPERVTGDYDYRSDLYGLAIVTYQMLVGHPPFQGEPTDILKDHLTKMPTPPSEANPAAGIPPSVEALLAKALAKDMGARYQTYQELVDAIDAILDSEYDPTVFAESAPEWTLMERVRSFLSPVLDGSKQTKQIAALGAALFFVVMTSIIILVTSGGDETESMASGESSVETGKVTQQTSRGAVVATDEVVARLADIEVILVDNGFVPSEASKITTLKNASLCDEGSVDGLRLTACVYDSSTTAGEARARVERASSDATSVVVANGDAVLWIVDQSAADPEGRRIQQLIEAFHAIE